MRNGSLFPEIWNGMDRWFADTLPGTPYATSKQTLGAVDVEETDNAYLLHFDIPGLKKEDVKIEIQNNELKVAGSREFSKDENHKSFKLRERSSGSFERVFHLGDQVDLDSVDAKFEDGVLNISLEKKASPKPRQIEIR